MSTTTLSLSREPRACPLRHGRAWATIAAIQALGFLWYSPLFGSAWIAAQGKRPEDVVPTATPFALSIASTIALVYGVSLALGLLEATGRRRSAGLALGLTFAFGVLPLATHYAFLGIHPTVTLIDSGMMLASSVIAGLSLGSRAENA